MARNTTVTLVPDVWTELTDADVASVTVQSKAADYIEVTGTSGAAPSGGGSIRLSPNMAIINRDLADLWPGVPGVVRVWARGKGEVLISHA